MACMWGSVSHGMGLSGELKPRNEPPSRAQHQAPAGCMACGLSGCSGFNSLLHMLALRSGPGCMPCGLSASLHAASAPLLSSLAGTFGTQSQMGCTCSDCPLPRPSLGPWYPQMPAGCFLHIELSMPCSF